MEHLRNDLSVAELAARVGMSPRNFARVFRSEMNMTPAKFVESLRLEAARRRLQESNASLESVATTCGFRKLRRYAQYLQARFASRARRVPVALPGEA